MQAFDTLRVSPVLLVKMDALAHVLTLIALAHHALVGLVTWFGRTYTMLVLVQWSWIASCGTQIVPYAVTPWLHILHVRVSHACGTSHAANRALLAISHGYAFALGCALASCALGFALSPLAPSALPSAAPIGHAWLGARGRTSCSTR